MQTPVYISEVRLQDLKNELLELKTVTIRKIAQQIDDAKQNGDLSENAEYADAKERMAFAHGRVMELENIISNAVIIVEKAASGTVHIGSKLVVMVADEKRTYEIVGSNEADPTAGKISNESPLGEAFIGRGIGDDVEVITPIKKTIFKILEIS